MSKVIEQLEFKRVNIRIEYQDDTPVITAGLKSIRLDSDASDYFKIDGKVIDDHEKRRFRVFSDCTRDDYDAYVNNYKPAVSYFRQQQLSIVGNYISVIKERTLELLTPDLETILVFGKFTTRRIIFVRWQDESYYIVERYSPNTNQYSIECYDSSLKFKYRQYKQLLGIIKNRLVTRNSFHSLSEGHECDEKYKMLSGSICQEYVLVESMGDSVKCVGLRDGIISFHEFSIPLARMRDELEKVCQKRALVSIVGREIHIKATDPINIHMVMVPDGTNLKYLSPYHFTYGTLYKIRWLENVTLVFDGFKYDNASDYCQFLTAVDYYFDIKMVNCELVNVH